jgi:hypothetical protein
MRPSWAVLLAGSGVQSGGHMHEATELAVILCYVCSNVSASGQGLRSTQWWHRFPAFPPESSALRAGVAVSHGDPASQCSAPDYPDHSKSVFSPVVQSGVKVVPSTIGTRVKTQ